MELSLDNLIEEANKLSYSDFQKLLKSYSHTHSIKEDNLTYAYSQIETETQIEHLGVNTKCPFCGSSQIKKNGKRNSIQRYQCHKCHKTFTLFTSTILEKSKYGWDIWVALLYLMLNNTSILSSKNILENDYGCTGIDDVIIWHMRMKLLYCISQLKVEVLSGVIQVDETFFRECQKGSRRLISMIKGEKRVARRGYKASKYGCMGSDYLNI